MWSDLPSPAEAGVAKAGRRHHAPAGLSGRWYATRDWFATIRVIRRRMNARLCGHEKMRTDF
jgi:hypothetical protein